MTAELEPEAPEPAPDPFPQPPMVITGPEDMGMDRDAPAVGEARAHEFPEGQWPRATT